MPSKWVEHVKKFARENNMKYGEAMGNAECKSQYHSSKGAGMEGGKIHIGKTFKKMNTKLKDAFVSKPTGVILQGVKKTGQIVKTGLNYAQKSGLTSEIPFADETINLVKQGIKQQNRGINYIQDKRQGVIEKRANRAMRAGSFKSFDGGSFNLQLGGSIPMHDKYEAVYGNTNGIDRFAQTFYPNPNDSKSRAITMFGHK